MEDDQDITSTQRTLTIIAGCLLALFAWFFGFRPFVVNGISMYPTFNASDRSSALLITGDYLIVDLFSYAFLREPKRFDVIVSVSPVDPGKHLLKRIIGLPNETVYLSGDDVRVVTADGKTMTLYEPYLNRRSPMTYRSQTIHLTDRQYFVLGDNRENSLDSRVWGALSREHIVGHALLRLFPFNRADIHPGHVSVAQKRY